MAGFNTWDSNMWNQFTSGFGAQPSGFQSPQTFNDVSMYTQAPVAQPVQLATPQIPAPTTQVMQQASPIAAPMSAFQTKDWMGNAMPMTQTQMQQYIAANPAAFEGVDTDAVLAGLSGEHGFMDKLGGMQGLMGLGQLGTSVMGIYNAFKQMQMQKDMFNAQKGIMNRNLENQVKTHNTALRDKYNARTGRKHSGYDANAAYERDKLDYKPV